MAFGRQLHQAEGQFRTVRNWNSNVRNVKVDSSCVVVVKPACEVDFATCELRSQRAKVNSKDQEGRLVRIENPQDTELDICVNIMDPPPEDQNSQQGQGVHPHASCLLLSVGYKASYCALPPNFHGMESENPYAHIKEFEEVCRIFEEIFPTHRTKGLKRQISNFSAKENEKFHECWERYMEAINACPRHGFDTWLLVKAVITLRNGKEVDQPLPNVGHDEEFMSKRPLIKESVTKKRRVGRKVHPNQALKKNQG
ncbi:hypothetical protein AAG906_001740 [Vitis piasezkii]